MEGKKIIYEKLKFKQQKFVVGFVIEVHWKIRFYQLLKN